jgi:hypothetical protein
VITTTLIVAYPQLGPREKYKEPETLRLTPHNVVSIAPNPLVHIDQVGEIINKSQPKIQNPES